MYYIAQKQGQGPLSIRSMTGGCPQDPEGPVKPCSLLQQVSQRGPVLVPYCTLYMSWDSWRHAILLKGERSHCATGSEPIRLADVARVIIVVELEPLLQPCSYKPYKFHL